MKWKYDDYKTWLESGHPVNDTITSLDISQHNIKTLKHVNRLLNLQTLDCSKNQIKNIEDLILPKLYSLNCNNNEIEEIENLDLPNLQTLKCYNNKIINLLFFQIY